MEQFGAPALGKEKINEQELVFFASVLKTARLESEKKMSDIRKELGLSSTAVVPTWEKGNGFPEGDSIPDVAKAYGIELEEFKRALKISKDARQKELEARRSIKPTSKGSQGRYSNYPAGKNFSNSRKGSHL